MRLRATANPTTTPVTLAEAKADLQVIQSSDDGKIQAAVDAAVSHLSGVNGTLGRALAKQTFELTLDRFPCSRLSLPLPPLASVESVKYVDTANVLQTLAPSAYVVDTQSEPGGLLPVAGWPATAPTWGAVTIAFTAGYDTTPAAIKAAALLLVRDLYDDEPGRYDAAIDRLVFPFKVFA